MSAQNAEIASLPDDELLALIAQGNDEALGLLYDRYGRLVYSIALRITGDRQSSEEVTQDVFQIVWQHVAGFRASEGSPGGWLVGITRHRAIDETRSRRHKTRAREVSTEDAPLDALRDGSNVERQAVLRTDVRAALGDLPTAQREAIELAYYGGMTCNEIASSTGMPVGTVKTRLRLGLTKLRSTLLPGWLGTGDE
jgi:RNA polymerase sigma-70 factor (ECF subfamily)